MNECLADPKRDVVILLHGLGRTVRSLWPLGWWLKAHGWRVLAVGYPSHHVGVAEAVEAHLNPVLERLSRNQGGRLHFVTHSLGGIVFRAWAAGRSEDFPLGRSVLLVPPNQGSEIIDMLATIRWPRWILGPVMDELGTNEEALPKRLGPVPPGVGILMGNRRTLPLFEHLLGHDHDGMVSVQGGHVEGEEAFTVMPVDHMTVLFHPRVWRAVHGFLMKGQFSG